PRGWLAGVGCALLLAGCNDSPRKATVLPEEGPPATPGDGGTPEPPPPDPCESAPRDPGRVTLHRLNRAEYDNTVRDLLGDTSGPASDFPAEDHGFGFDN